MTNDADQAETLSHRQLGAEDFVYDVIGDGGNLLGGRSGQTFLQQRRERLGRNALGIVDREVRFQGAVVTDGDPNEGLRLTGRHPMALVERASGDLGGDFAVPLGDPDQHLNSVRAIGNHRQVVEQSAQPRRHHSLQEPSTIFLMHLAFPIRSDKLTMSVRVENHVAHSRSAFQTIDIYDTAALGRILTLDGHIQLATLDERAYHEALVQVPLLNVVDARRALVVGGGDGGVLREVCRWPGIEGVDIVEIDREVIDLCREHLPGLSGDAYDDARVQLHVADAFEFVARAEAEYDLIVVDCTDVYEEEEGGISEQLFTDDFYRDCLARLSPKGFVVTQADNLLFCPYSLEAILEAFGRVFPATGSYWAIVPSFGGFSGYAWASRGARPAPHWEDVPGRLGGLEYLSATTYDLGMGRLPIG